jgi:hypothetical protein
LFRIYTGLTLWFWAGTMCTRRELVEHMLPLFGVPSVQNGRTY